MSAIKTAILTNTALNSQDEMNPFKTTITLIKVKDILDCPHEPRRQKFSAKQFVHNSVAICLINTRL